MAETTKTKSDHAGGQEGSSSRRLGYIYAEALLNAADKTGKANELEAELESLYEALEQNSSVRALLSTKGIQRSEREPIIKKAFENKIDPLLYDFLGVLNKKDRLDLLADVAIGFRELLDERAHRVRVVVRSARALSDEQQKSLLSSLESTLRTTPVLDLKVDPDLLGGLVVQVGDEVYDNSVKTRIEFLRNQLLSRSSHEIQIGRDRFSSAS
jgi:F-type H+-transporting ATPase subunit delta